MALKTLEGLGRNILDANPDDGNAIAGIGAAIEKACQELPSDRREAGDTLRLALDFLKASYLGQIANRAGAMRAVAQAVEAVWASWMPRVKPDAARPSSKPWPGSARAAGRTCGAGGNGKPRQPRCAVAGLLPATARTWNVFTRSLRAFWKAGSRQKARRTTCPPLAPQSERLSPDKAPTRKPPWPKPAANWTSPCARRSPLTRFSRRSATRPRPNLRRRPARPPRRLHRRLRLWRLPRQFRSQRRTSPPHFREPAVLPSNTDLELLKEYIVECLDHISGAEAALLTLEMTRRSRSRFTPSSAPSTRSKAPPASSTWSAFRSWPTRPRTSSIARGTGKSN